jgi:hypothetical protein
MAIQMSLLNALGGNFFKRGWDMKFFGRTDFISHLAYQPEVICDIGYWLVEERGCF